MSGQLDPTEVLPVGEQVQSVDRLELTPESHVISAARAFVLEHAPPLTTDTRETLRLLTSELVTNAVIHARTTIELSLVVGEQNVLVTVHDLDVGHVEPRAAAVREGGWGLGLVQSLADRADMIRHSSGGKTAWFTLRRDA